jgi:hypothetical protein
LLICGLSFDQLAKHNKNFIEHFHVDKEGLHDSLAVAIEVEFQGKPLVIRPGEVNVPALAYENFDPDSSYYPVPVENSELNTWMSTDRTKTAKLLWPPEDDIETVVTMASELAIGSRRRQGIPSISNMGRGHSLVRALEYKAKKN